ncbi:MAG: ATP-binding protein [bacterium]
MKESSVEGKVYPSISLLLIENNYKHQRLIEDTLLQGPLMVSITTVDTGEKGLQLIESSQFDIILLNYALRRMNGLEFQIHMREKGYNIPTIMIADHGSEEVAVQAMKLGTYDYIRKTGKYVNRLNSTIQNALKQHEIRIQQEERLDRMMYVNKRQQQEQQKLENIISAIGAGLMIIDKGFRIIWLNRTMEEWFKESGDSLEGTACHVLFKRAQKPCPKCIMCKTFEDGLVQRLNHSGINKSGEQRHYQLTTTPLTDVDGNITQVLCLVQDITQQIEMQLKLIQGGRLAAIGELASGLAHQLNNPLVGILNYVQLLQRRLEPTDPNRELLDTVEMGAKQCKDIVRNLLNFSRPFTFHFEMVDLGIVLDDALILIENESRAGKVRFMKDMENQLPPIQGNAIQIQQAFLNILMNALDAMPQGGEMKIYTRIIHQRKGRDYAVIKFSDSGHGIPRSIIDKIFDPFFTTKEEGKGTGLGLSIASGIVKAHNGKIEVESQKGVGTTFSLFFPIAHQR